jgi:heme/copper-type cytochrome/quinol oxidase subunit 2
MSQIMDPVGAAPETRSVHFLTLLFGAAAAPIFWVGQLMLGYAVTAYACYPGDHPVQVRYGSALLTTVIVFDIVALIVCAAGGLVSWRSWQAVRADRGHRHTLHTGEGRDRFLAMWGLLSSLCFFFAILFNTIASVTVTPCLN